jgi:hypothetical protein
VLLTKLFTLDATLLIVGAAAGTTFAATVATFDTVFCTAVEIADVVPVATFAIPVDTALTALVATLVTLLTIEESPQSLTKSLLPLLFLSPNIDLSIL